MHPTPLIAVARFALHLITLLLLAIYSNLREILQAPYPTLLDNSTIARILHHYLTYHFFVEFYQPSFAAATASPLEIMAFCAGIHLTKENKVAFKVMTRMWAILPLILGLVWVLWTGAGNRMSEHQLIVGIEHLGALFWCSSAVVTFWTAVVCAVLRWDLEVFLVGVLALKIGRVLDANDRSTLKMMDAMGMSRRE